MSSLACYQCAYGNCTNCIGWTKGCRCWVCFPDQEPDVSTRCDKCGKLVFDSLYNDDGTHFGCEAS